MDNECLDFIPEQNNPYPLCINERCGHNKTCNKSALMKENVWEEDKL